MTEYIVNISMCKPVNCTVCSLLLKDKTIFMMHDKPFCSPKCKEKYFLNSNKDNLRNHLKRSDSDNGLNIS